MRPARLLFIRDTGSFGGVERQMVGFATRFDPDLLHPIICTFSDEGGSDNPLLMEARNNGLETAVIPAEKGLDLENLRHLTGLLDDLEVDMLCPQDYRSRFLALYAAGKRRIPVVATAHGYTGHTPKVKVYESFDRLLVMRRMDRVICVSDALRRRLARWGVPSEKLFRVYNSVDVDGRPEEPVDQGERIVLSVGRLSVEKGHRFLLDAWRSVAAKHPDCSLWLVGDGPERQSLEDQAGRLGIKSSVRFVGAVDDPMPIFRRCEVFVMPSLAEGLPVALLEACSAGKPSVASDVGGMGEVISHDRNGLLVRSGKPGQIASSLIRLLEDREMAASMGESARQTVSVKFSFQSNAPLLEQVYLSLLGLRGWEAL